MKQIDEKITKQYEKEKSKFVSDFFQQWKRFDSEFQQRKNEMKETRRLNGKATNHQINL